MILINLPGDGPIIDTRDINGRFLSTLNAAVALPFSFGCHRPLALIIVLIDFL